MEEEEKERISARAALGNVFVRGTRWPVPASAVLRRLLSFLKSTGSCLNALYVHAQRPNPGPARPLSTELT